MKLEELQASVDDYIQEQSDILDDVVASTQDPESTRAGIENAGYFSRKLGMPITDAYQLRQALGRQLTGIEAPTDKDISKAIKDLEFEEIRPPNVQSFEPAPELGFMGTMWRNVRNKIGEKVNPRNIEGDIQRGPFRRKAKDVKEFFIGDQPMGTALEDENIPRVGFKEAVKGGYESAGADLVGGVLGRTKFIGEATGNEKLKAWSGVMESALEQHYRDNPSMQVPIIPGTGAIGTMVQAVRRPEIIVQSLVEMVPMIAMGYLGGTQTRAMGIGRKVGTIGGITENRWGPNYLEARKQNDNIIEAWAQATLQSAGEGILEEWSLSAKVDLFKGAFGEWTKKSMAKKSTDFLLGGGKAGLRGATEEGGQTANSKFWELIFADDKGMREAFVEAIGDPEVGESAGIGFVMESLMAGTFKASGKFARAVMLVPDDIKLMKLEQLEKAVQEEPGLTPDAKAELIIGLEEQRAHVLSGMASTSTHVAKTVEEAQTLADDLVDMATEKNMNVEITQQGTRVTAKFLKEDPAKTIVQNGNVVQAAKEDGKGAVTERVEEEEVVEAAVVPDTRTSIKDKSGEPIKILHGTRSDLKVSDISIDKIQTGKYGKGIGFTPDRAVAETHSRRGFAEDGESKVLEAQITEDAKVIEFDNAQEFEVKVENLIEFGKEFRDRNPDLVKEEVRDPRLDADFETAKEQARRLNPVTREEAIAKIIRGYDVLHIKGVSYSKRFEDMGFDERGNSLGSRSEITEHKIPNGEEYVIYNPDVLISTKPTTQPTTSKPVDIQEPQPEAKHQGDVSPNLSIGNLTQRGREVWAEVFGVKPQDVRGHLDKEGAFKTTRTAIPMTRELAKRYLDFLEKHIEDVLADQSFETNAVKKMIAGKVVNVKETRKVFNQIDPTTAARLEADWGDVKALREVLGIEKSPSTFTLKRAGKKSIITIENVKERIRKSVTPSLLSRPNMTTSQILSAAMKKAEQASSKAWIESAKNIIKIHKDVAKYIKERMQDTDLTKGEQNRLLAKVAQAKNEKTKAAIIASVEMLRDAAQRRAAKAELAAALKNAKPKDMFPVFGKQAKKLKDLFALTAPKEETVNQRKELLEFAEAALAESNRLDPDSVTSIEAEALAKSLRATTRKIPISGLSLAEMREITDILTGLDAMNKQEDAIISQRDAETAEKRRKEIKDSITKRKVFEGKVSSKLAPAGVWIANNHGSLEFILDAISGGVSGIYSKWAESKNPITKYVYDVINEGVRRQYRQGKAAMLKLQSLVVKHNMDPVALANEMHTFKMKDFFGNDIDVEFAKTELMSIFMHTRNTHNLESLLENGMDKLDDGTETGFIRGFTRETLDDMIGTLTTEEKAFCREVGSGLMDGINRKAMNKTSLQMEGREIARIGHYWPAHKHVIRDMSGKKPKGVKKLLESLGFLKERTGTGNPLVLKGFFHTVYETNKNVAAYTGLAPALRDVKIVFNSEVKTLYDANGWKAEARVIDDFIIKVEDGSSELSRTEKKVAKTFSLIRGHFAKSVFGLNAKLWGRQQISSLLMKAYVDGKYMSAMRGVSDPETEARVRALSPEADQRFDSHRYDRETGDAAIDAEFLSYVTGDNLLDSLKKSIDRKDVKSTISNAQLVFLQGMRYFDKNAIVDVFRATEAEQQGERPDLKPGTKQYDDALRARFEWLVRHTQPMWHVKDRSLLGSSSDTMIKNFTMFFSQREQITRMVSMAAIVYANSEKTAADVREFATVAATVLGNIALFTAYNMMWAMGVTGADKDVKDAMLEFIKATVGNVFFFGPAIAEIARKAEGITEGRWVNIDIDSGPVSMIEPGLEGIAYLMVGMSGAINGDKDWKADVGKGAELIFQSTLPAAGLPYAGPKNLTTRFRTSNKKSKGSKAKLQKI